MRTGFSGLPSFLGEQQRTEAAAEQNADERGNDRQLCAEKKARAEHQLDITAAEAAGHDERQKQHRYADDHAADQPRFIPRLGISMCAATPQTNSSAGNRS